MQVWVKFENVEEGVTVAKQTDDVTGLSTLVVIDGKRRPPVLLNCCVRLSNCWMRTVWKSVSRYDYAGFCAAFPVGAVITVREGQEVGKGDVLARIPQASSKTRDITGGLPRVAELFEARVPKDAGLLAEITGTVSFGKRNQLQTASDYYRRRRCSYTKR